MREEGTEKFKLILTQILSCFVNRIWTAAELISSASVQMRLAKQDSNLLNLKKPPKRVKWTKGCRVEFMAELSG